MNDAHLEITIPPEVYHASGAQGLQLIEPRISTHGAAWVYAARDLRTAALFLGKHHDFILASGHIGETLYLCERFAGALDRAKAGVSGSIYSLPSSSFKVNRTSWHGDLVSEVAVAPLSEIRVADAKEFVLRFVNAGSLEFYPYPSRPSHIPSDDSDLIAAALELHHQHGDKLLEYLKRETGDELAHVLRALHQAN